MKKTLITLLLLVPLAASGQAVTSYGNSDGSEDFYHYRHGYMGTAYRNSDGGRDFVSAWPQHYGNNYCCPSQPIRDGHAIGSSLARIINLMRGANQ